MSRAAPLVSIPWAVLAAIPEPLTPLGPRVADFPLPSDLASFTELAAIWFEATWEGAEFLEEVAGRCNTSPEQALMMDACRRMCIELQTAGIKPS